MRLVLLVLLLPLGLLAGPNTGKGSPPIASTWVCRENLHAVISSTSTGNPSPAVWNDWLFVPSTPPPTTVMKDPIGRGRQIPVPR